MHGEHGERWSIYRCGYADLAAVLGAAGVKADALIVDAPYSAKTHAGHDAGTILDSRGVVERPDIRDNRERQKLGLPSMRRSLDYASWTPLDVRDFVLPHFGSELAFGSSSPAPHALGIEQHRRQHPVRRLPGEP